jgi:hypothetical protein
MKNVTIACVGTPGYGNRLFKAVKKELINAKKAKAIVNPGLLLF